MKRTKIAVALVAVVIGLTGCSSSDSDFASESASDAGSAPTKDPAVEQESAAAEEPFCAAYHSAMAGVDGNAWNDAGAQLEDIGAPDDMSADEKAGFEVFVKAAKTMPANQNALQDQIADLPLDQLTNVDVFLAYAVTTCGA